MNRSRLDPRGADGPGVVLPRAPRILLRQGSHYGNLVLQHRDELAHVEDIGEGAAEKLNHRGSFVREMEGFPFLLFFFLSLGGGDPVPVE